MATVERTVKRAATYVRISTEHQAQSIATQVDAIKAYAETHGLEVVRTYADEGRSGLTLRGRPALQDLLANILDGRAGVEVLLVYDVSRWGRFQDADESAHYEFLCRQAGVEVVYVAESFPSEAAGLGAIGKSLKRLMAAEFSRELGRKVASSQNRLAAIGHRQGGGAPFGYQRWLVDDEGHAVRQLTLGDRKPRHIYSVTLRPGPEEAVRIVRLIFDLASLEQLDAEAIARRLNEHQVPSPKGKRWRGSTILRICSNPVYTGHLVYRRTTERLGSPTRMNPSADWIVGRRGCPATVTQAQFDEAKRRLCRGPSHHCSDLQLLDGLRRLHAQHGRLSSALINADLNLPSTSEYRRHFGSLLTAYRAVGYEPANDLPGGAYLSWQVNQVRRAVAKAAQELLSRHGLTVGRSNSRLDADGVIVELVLLTPFHGARGGWRLSSAPGPANFYLVGRLAKTRDKIADFAIVVAERMPDRARTYDKRAVQALADGRFEQLAEIIPQLAAEMVGVGLGRAGST